MTAENTADLIPVRGQDLTGQKFNRWTAIRFQGIGEGRKYLWLFRCDCGTEKILGRESIVRGRSKSCGCYNRDVSRARKILSQEEINRRNLVDANGMKLCKYCGITKPTTEFHRVQKRSGRVRPQHACKSCSDLCFREYRKEWAKKNPEKMKKWGREFHLKKFYGLTMGTFEVMNAAQAGKCAICSDEVKMYVDHCHESNKIRKLLCFHCNTGLGHYRDNPTLLRAAADYLESHRPSPPSNTPDSGVSPDVTGQ